ncbi:hypothetical protein F7230_08240 [Corynebacterium sp. 320]|uniref:hypothetical protein n=1 Tax=Corynebacterium TaxID=1716 RepID=UPI00125CBE19|nr:MULTISPECIES: hypothetical protein [Corynebacterium]KAB1502424.1 hypothetical protein F7230_08240 [Corynebacterium sp. 320]KAB1551355.1 hypothetical protein F7233_07540 [Corynebacterium sp. 321]KAB1551816.1 hypothetical protein F7232_06730 [Corynebacterium sp. 319]KAB3526031.1 hypothetical protein F8354_08240 [Corynebacterium sp. 250]KAB3538811.1 hypothetical protein F8390_07310 [Corynebacterium sp. 366]
MNTDIRWTVPSDGHTFPIYAGPAQDMDRIAEFADERGVTNIRFGGDTWELSADNGPKASAVTGSGTWTATGDAETFAKSKQYVLQADRHTVTIIAESKSHFVLDIDGEKAGQFTSENRGLRNLHVEFEGPGEKLPLDVQVFISWVARRIMEVRTLNSTKALLIALLLCIPVIVAYWIGAI